MRVDENRRAASGPAAEPAEEGTSVQNEVAGDQSAGASGDTDASTQWLPSLFPADVQPATGLILSGRRPEIDVVRLRLDLAKAAREVQERLEEATRRADAAAAEAKDSQERVKQITEREAAAELRRTLFANGQTVKFLDEDLANFNWEERQKMWERDNERWLDDYFSSSCRRH